VFLGALASAFLESVMYLKDICYTNIRTPGFLVREFKLMSLRLPMALCVNGAICLSSPVRLSGIPRIRNEYFAFAGLQFVPSDP